MTDFYPPTRERCTHRIWTWCLSNSTPRRVLEGCPHSKSIRSFTSRSRHCWKLLKPRGCRNWWMTPAPGRYPSQSQPSTTKDRRRREQWCRGGGPGCPRPPGSRTRRRPPAWDAATRLTFCDGGTTAERAVRCSADGARATQCHCLTLTLTGRSECATGASWC